MNNKESENSKSRGAFLSKEAGSTLRLKGAKVREIATKTQKELDRILPYAGEKTLQIRLK